MIEITESSSKLSITDSSGEVVVVEQTRPSVEIQSVGKQGASYTPSDVEIIARANDGTKTFSFTGGQLNQINIADANGATNHVKAFTYKTQAGETVVNTIVDSFNYNSQVWTYTKTFIYVVGTTTLDEIRVTLTKV